MEFGFSCLKKGLLSIALGVALLQVGCHHVPADMGGSSFVVLDPPPPGGKKQATEAKERLGSEYFEEAEPMMPLAQPIYPAKALAAKAGRATVGVRITVDVTGRIRDIEPSMRAFSTPGPYAEEFLAAVRTALDQWRFKPARIDHIERVNVAEVSYTRVASSEPAETYFDLVFNFASTGSGLPTSLSK